MSLTEAPFNTKIKLECDCGACESKYRIIYFEDETVGDIKSCPFCGEPIEEFSETNQIAEEVKDTDSETIYTDDEYARFEEEVLDDDDDVSPGKEE